MDSLPDSLNLDFLPSITGSFSTPARQNPTVAIVEAAYRHHNIHARYLNCEVSPKNLGDAVRGAKAMGWIGFNCSIPHKVEVIKYLDELGKSASLIGAVNCVVLREGKLTGENTDGSGFLISLRTIIDPKGKELFVFGAGGAARAIAVEAALAGARTIRITNRDSSRGEELARLIQDKTDAEAMFVPWENGCRVPESADIVVNATSVGFHPNTEATVDVDPESLLPSMIVADVIPNPPFTTFLRRAAERGCHTLDGLGMLVFQGVAAIKFWTSISVDPTVMRDTLETIFKVK